jgi:hypothetical protein
MELAHKGTDAARARSQSQVQSVTVPLITRVFSKAAGAMTAPNREAKVRA